MNQLNYWLWLTTRKGLGEGALPVLRQFGGPEAAYYAQPRDYDLIPGLRPEGRQSLLDKSMEEAEAILADCDRLGVDILTLPDSGYPERLRNIEDPPPVLYVKGRMPRVDDELTVALAGTRRCTPYGRQQAGALSFQITRLGGLVATGVVEGCYWAAATAALKAGGPLICVLAGGVDVLYHATEEYRHLYADVARAGALVSEYPPGARHLGPQFLRRNRILTGLSLGVVCVEGGQGSGTLKVADLALSQNRDVFAVPANVDVTAAAGTNRLLKEGAVPVFSGADVVDYYRALFPVLPRAREPLSSAAQAQRLAAEQPEPKPPEAEKPVDKMEKSVYITLQEHQEAYTDDEQAVLLALREGALSADELIDRTQLPSRRVSQTLTLLELRELVRREGQRYRACVILVTE